MISLHNVTKRILLHGKDREVLSGVSLTIPTDRRIALLKPNEHDKLVFLHLLAGIILPTRGRIVRKARVSFPVGYLGGFSPELSVRHNIMHVARLYRVNAAELLAFVEQVGEFSMLLDQRFQHLPGPLKNQLGLIIAYGIPFDVYLLPRERGRAKGNPADFQQTAMALHEMRARTCGMIVVVNNPNLARNQYDGALILHRGRLHYFDDMEAALSLLSKLPPDPTVWQPGRREPQQDELEPLDT